MNKSAVLVTGASGNAGQPLCRALLQAGYQVRMADVGPPAADLLEATEFIRCDTRTPADVNAAVKGMGAVIHLAAWHSGHRPRVSDPTIFAVNVDGTFNLLEACRAEGIKAFVFASSMAYGWGDVYAATKVLGEDLCKTYHQMTGMAMALLRYHAFVPGPYLEYGARLLRNGVDRQDVVTATVASLEAVLEQRVQLFRTIVHTAHGMPNEVVQNFRQLGPEWCESRLSGAKGLLEKYQISLPEQVEQHDLSEAERVLGWKPKVGFLEFLRDLQRRDSRGEDVSRLWVPGELPEG